MWDVQDKEHRPTLNLVYCFQLLLRAAWCPHLAGKWLATPPTMAADRKALDDKPLIALLSIRLGQ